MRLLVYFPVDRIHHSRVAVFLTGAIFEDFLVRSTSTDLALSIFIALWRFQGYQVDPVVCLFFQMPGKFQEFHL